MFNTEIKERYIREKENEVIVPKHFLRSKFNKVAETEELLNKDVCNFTTYEILDYYKTLNLDSLDSLRVINSMFGMYTQWCLQELLVEDNQNHFLECSTDLLLKCINVAVVNKKIVSREQLLKWVSELPNPRDQFMNKPRTPVSLDMG